MRFLKFTRPDHKPVWVARDHIVTVTTAEGDANWQLPVRSALMLVNGHAQGIVEHIDDVVADLTNE